MHVRVRTACRYNHAQNLGIFAQLYLAWPRSVASLLEAMGISVVNIQLTRPECMLEEAGGVDSSLGGAFYLINTM